MLGGALGSVLGGSGTGGGAGGAGSSGGFDLKFLVSAAMMVIAAKRDGQIDQSEMSSIVQTVTQHFGLDLGNAQSLVSGAVSQLNVPGAEGAFTQAVKSGFGEDERKGLMGMLWQVLGDTQSEAGAPQMSEQTVRSLGHEIGLDDGAIDEAKAATSA